MQIIDINQGDLIQELVNEIKERGIKTAALTLIGGVENFTILNMPKNDATSDILTTYNQPGELTGTGEIVDGKPHVHVVCGIEGDDAKAGHLHAADIDTWFVRVYVVE